jgi:ribosome maturation factor RimP
LTSTGLKRDRASRARLDTRCYNVSNSFRGPGRGFESGRSPAFLLEILRHMSAIQTGIEARLADVEPDVEVLLAEVVGGKLVRLFIDHPKGVSLELCERVTKLLPEVRERYALEVSSPGPERPLSKPDHFRRFVGRRARVRTRRRLPEGHASVTGELIGATDDAVTVAADTGVVSIAYADIQRSNLVGE